MKNQLRRATICANQLLIEVRQLDDLAMGEARVATKVLVVRAENLLSSIEQLANGSQVTASEDELVDDLRTYKRFE